MRDETGRKVSGRQCGVAQTVGETARPDKTPSIHPPPRAGHCPESLTYAVSLKPQGSQGSKIFLPPLSSSEER